MDSSLIDEMPLRWVQDYMEWESEPTTQNTSPRISITSYKAKSLSSFSWTDWLDWFDMNILSLFAPPVVLLFVISLILWRKETFYAQMDDWVYMDINAIDCPHLIATR